MYIKNEELCFAGVLLLMVAAGLYFIHPEAWKHACIGTGVGMLMMLFSVRVR
jgi:hypothetical protein